MRALTPFLVVPLVAGLAGCGMAGEPGSPAPETWGASASYAETPIEEILVDVENAMTDVESVRMAGTVIDGKDHITMNLRVDGKSCAGSLSIKGVGSMEILVVDGVSYFKADRAFWVSQAGEDAATLALDTIAGRWATDSTDPDGFGDLCDIDEMTSAIEAEDIGDGGTEVVGPGSVDGSETVVLSFESEDGNSGKAHVTTAEPHRLVKYDVPGEGVVTLSEYNKALDIEKPAAKDVVDLGTSPA